MTIRCRGREFNTHRAIVCTQSPFFRAALSGGFKEGTSGIVSLLDDDPDIVQCFLEFLYTGSYSTDGLDLDTLLGASEAVNTEVSTRLRRQMGSGSSFVPIAMGMTKSKSREMAQKSSSREGSRWRPYAFRALPAGKKRPEAPKPEQLKHAVQVYLLADKYDVPALRLLASHQFFKWAKECCLERLWLESRKSTEFFSEIVDMIYRNTASGEDPLRRALVQNQAAISKTILLTGMAESGTRSGAPSSTGSEYRDGEYDAIDALCATSIHASLSTLLRSEKFSDMTIRCGGRDFKAHCAIVCTQSSFFDRALGSNFKVGYATKGHEATSRVVELPDDDPDVLERFLEFLYTGTYTDNVNHTWGKPSNVATMSPEEVQENLSRAPGVLEDVRESDENRSIPRPGSRNSYQIGPARDDDDPDYESVSVHSDSNSEPDEEYNEYHAESPSEEQDPGNPSLGARFMMKLSELDALDKAEALQKLAQMRNDMALPLRLYVMADKYDVAALRLLARDRFYRAVELEWEYAECFPDIVDELYLCTPQTDTAMREIVCRMVGSRILSTRVREKMKPVMEKHGDFAVGVMEYAIHSGKFRIQ
ncbi:hypothetical protein ACHAPT_004699 [Fusarium lateritium]